MTDLRSTRLRNRLVPWLVLLLLLAQGLRLCIPAATPDREVQSVHLESVLTTVADQHESDSAGDVDLPLSLLLKTFDTSAVTGVLLAFVFVLFLLPQNPPKFRPGVSVFRPVRGHGVIPPSRAPPR
jgi:hypothetical protein